MFAINNELNVTYVKENVMSDLIVIGFNDESTAFAMRPKSWRVSLR